MAPRSSYKSGARFKGRAVMPVQNAEIATMFDQTADLLEIEGENQFRVRAYRKAARTVESLSQSVRSLLSAEQDLSDFRGSARICRQDRRHCEDRALRSAGRAEEEAARRARRNRRTSRAWPKRVKLLYDKLKVRTLDDLRRAIMAGRLRELKGFGPVIERSWPSRCKNQPPRSGSSSRWRKRKPRRWSPIFATAAAWWWRELPTAPGYCGGPRYSRHRRAWSGGRREAGRLRQCRRGARRGQTRTAVVLRSGIQVDMRVVPEQSYGAALLYFTGSKAHNIALRGIATITTGSSMNMACSPVHGGSPAPPRRRSTRNSGSPMFRRKCARTAARSLSLRRTCCRGWSRWRTYAVISTSIPTGPTVRPRSKRWPRPHRPAATPTWRYRSQPAGRYVARTRSRPGGAAES